MKQIEERLKENIKCMFDGISTKLKAVEKSLSEKIESEITLLRERANKLESAVANIGRERAALHQVRIKINQIFTMNYLRMLFSLLYRFTFTN